MYNFRVLLDSKTAPPAEGYSLGGFLFDAAVGAVAFIAIAASALALGGFSFFTPWLIVAPPIMFAAGMIRGSSQGNTLLKSLSITLGTLLLSICFTNTDVYTVALGMLIVIIPTALGILVRRRLPSSQKDKSIDSE